MDYRRFLGSAEELVLPYVGGTFVDTGKRRVRVDSAVSPGHYLFRIEGRHAKVVEPRDPIDLSAMPGKTGHFVSAGGSGYVALDDGQIEVLHLVPADEPQLLTPVRGRRWHDGALLFGEVLFESDVEERARRALEEGTPLDAEKGIGAALRVAWAVALAVRTARSADVAVSPGEVRSGVAAIASGGAAAAREIVDRIVVRRAEHDRALAERLARDRIQRIARDVDARAATERRNAPAATMENAEERASAALQHAGALLHSTRRLAGGSIEVRYQFLGERFISVVDATTLQVTDAGVCLAGADSELTLDSLPSAIREAIDTDVLVITRR